MPIYSYITQTAAVQEISNRLYDPTQTFWTAAEVALYLNEALQTWNALTGFWRGDFTFSTSAATQWYDLTSTVQMPSTLRPLTTTLLQLCQIIEYHLLEPISAVAGGSIAPWTGSLQYSLDDILSAIQRRRDEILSITSCTQTRSLIPAVAGRIQLSDSVIDVRRMAYLPSSLFPGGGGGSSYYGDGLYGVGYYGQANAKTNNASVMWPEDTWGEQSFNRNYTLAPAGTPFAYLLSTQPPISFDTDRPPAYAGSYELLTVNAGPLLSVAAPSALLSIPDDWAHVLKWGALADLFSREWDAKDTPRATYCEQRYRLGLAAMLQAPALLALRLDNVPLQIDSVRAGDQYNTSWEATPAGKPSQCYHAGLNLIALSATPDAGTYSLMATVVENAPLPVNPTDPVQVSRDDLDAIIDYAQHIASLKMGGDEFARTTPLLQRFLKQAAVYNGKLSELAEYTSILGDLSQRERDMAPVSTPDGEQAATA